MDFTLSAEEKTLLLQEAREAIAARLERRKPHFEETGLSLLCGAFVTIRINGQLRGCIGRMTADEALDKTVQTMAVQAAFGDPRFPPPNMEEFEKCDIEISALSPMELCPDPRSVEVGRHGLYLSYRGRVGVLLPQVPVEQGWGLDEYLDYICVKAGLPPGSYEADGAELYTFTALVFP
jgi:AmmeMemoRadiSam system protein A